MAEPTYTEIFEGPRKIEHTSPQPLTEEEINQILAEPPSADQQRAYDQQAVRDYILSQEFDSPYAVGPGDPNAVRPNAADSDARVVARDAAIVPEGHQVFQRGIDPRPAVRPDTTGLWDQNLDPGAGQYDTMTSIEPHVPQVTTSPLDSTPAAHPGLSGGLNFQEGEALWGNTKDDFGRHWWQVPVGDELPDAFRDLSPEM